MTQTTVTTSEPVGRTGFVDTYPCQDIPDAPELNAALRSLWASLNALPPEESARRLAAAERVEANAAAYQRELSERTRAKRKVTADTEFTAAFDTALKSAGGLQRPEAARVVAKATARYFLGTINGKTIERLSGIYTRYGSDVCRTKGAALAREIAVDPERIRSPLGALEHRCREAAGGAA